MSSRRSLLRRIRPYSCHASRTSLEIYSQVALADAQESYDKVIDRFPS
jgi:integrase/recombinase XerD